MLLEPKHPYIIQYIKVNGAVMRLLILQHRSLVSYRTTPFISDIITYTSMYNMYHIFYIITNPFLPRQFQTGVPSVKQDG